MKMIIKPFTVTVMAVLFCMVFIACYEEPEIPPLYGDWKERIERGRKKYNDFRYKIEDGEIKILRYEGEGGTVTIPAEIEEIPVTTIGLYAFRETKLTEIIIPDSITTIGEMAFFDNELTDLFIPDSVKKIEYYAFASNKLTSVTISHSITIIEYGIFYNNKLTSVIIPNGVTKVYHDAFGFNPLVEITIGKNVSLNDFAFSSVSIDHFIVGGFFAETYKENGRLAGTYTRPDVYSAVWTRQ